MLRSQEGVSLSSLAVGLSIIAATSFGCAEAKSEEPEAVVDPNLIVYQDHQALMDWHQANEIPIPLVDLRRPTYRQDMAQSIRDNAGLPEGQTAGIQEGVTPGHSGQLRAQASPYNITSERAAAAIASRGTGTKDDPYIIEGLEFDGQGEAARGLNFRDSDADYHVTVRNCLFRDFDAECIKINWSDTPVTIEHSTLYNTRGEAPLIRRIEGNLNLSALVFAGCDTFGAYVDTTSTEEATVNMRNISITDDHGEWSSGGDVFQIKAPNTTFNIQYLESEARMAGNESMFQLLNCHSDTVISNVKFTGGFNYFMTDNDDNSHPTSFTLENFDIADSRRELIYMNNVDGAEIRYGNASHVAGGKNHRVIYFDSVQSDNTRRVQDIYVHHLKMTKQTGERIAGNEVLESRYGTNIRFEHCWVDGAVEDAYEHVTSLGGCTIAYCVGDDVVGQVVDFFKVGVALENGRFAIQTDHESITSAQANYTHHIYGDTISDHAVIISGMQWTFGHDFYVDTSQAPTNKAVLCIQDRENRNGAPPSIAGNSQFSGPFTEAAERSDQAVLLKITRDALQTINYQYFEAGEYRGFENDDVLRWENHTP